MEILKVELVLTELSLAKEWIRVIDSKVWISWIQVAINSHAGKMLTLKEVAHDMRILMLKV